MSEPTLVKIREPGPGESDGPITTTSEDVARWNREMEWKRANWGGLRVLRMTFRCPWPCTRGQYQQYENLARKKWITDRDLFGWDFKEQFAVNWDSRREATAFSGDYAILLPGYVEIPVLGLFQKRKVESRRIEVPVAG
jgi:hypothetical protein